jgi:hypothetical protein
MSNITEKILADAKSRRPEYADRMTVIGPQTESLPTGLEHYGIKISQLRDYTPMNYIVKNGEIFTSMQRGDFRRLLMSLRVIEDEQLSAVELTSLFILIEQPFINRHLVDKIEDLTLPNSVSMRERLLLAQKLAPPKIQYIYMNLECTFWAFNARTRMLERFFFKVTPDYQVEGEVEEITSFKE